MFQNRSLKFKVLSIFALASMVSAIVAGVGYVFANRVIAHYDSIVSDNLPNIAQFVQMNASQVRMVLPVAQLVGANTTPDEAKKAQEVFDIALKEFNDSAKIYEALPFTDAEKKNWDVFKGETLEKFKSLATQMIHLSGTGDKGDLEKRDKIWELEFAESRKSVRQGFDQIIKAQTDEAREKGVLAVEENTKKNFWTAIIVLLGVTSSLGAGYVMVQSIANAVKKASISLSDGTSQVLSASEQLSQASQQLAAGASTSAASLEEGVASIEELSSMVQMSAGNSKQAASLSNEGFSQAAISATGLEQLTSRMKGIQESSRKIEEIIGVIDDIAFQTNLLALNASVEAARAGDQGKGFAVVAEAVRGLAQKSAASAKDISTLIQHSVSQIDEGVRYVEDSNKAMGDLKTAVKKISDLNQEISSANSEQATGINQLSTAMNSLDKSVQGNAATSEEIAASAEQLSAQAALMQSTAHQLAVIVDGGVQGELAAAS